MNLPGETEAGLCREATISRDNRAGSSSRCLAAREPILSRCALRGKGHRTIDPHALKNPHPAGAESTLTENVSSPFFEKFQERLLAHHKANTAPRTHGFYKENLAVLMRFTPLASAKLSSIDSAMIESLIQW